LNNKPVNRYKTCALQDEESEKNHPQFFAIYNNNITLLSELITLHGIDRSVIGVYNNNGCSPCCVVGIIEYAILKLGFVPECISNNIANEDIKV